MSTPYTRAPHQGSPGAVQAAAPNAALLIDFDNVTMGMRSDLSKDLQKLLQSEIIKGKVTVQRAYADWRRYPQYIVPLSENSIDLIFAPAYGSSKKNATDIRMAIDGMELVFTRPEIGTYILLTGDSDFSSLVIKLKEYGKYVIGVGIQESSSDILVQNCDEYYSYTSLAGLQKTNETDQKPADPWVLVEQAVKKMKQRDDVMRSDRLKQVMIEIDASFDEGNFGFSKFSKFLTEAASKGLVSIRKLDNGQYEVSSSGSGSGRDRGGRGDGGRDRGGRGGRQDRGRGDRGGRKEQEKAAAPRAKGDPLQDSYGLLRRALEQLLDDGKDAVRDSDVKRRMLEFDRSFDEAELGFSKFSQFLRQADEHDVIELHQRESGNFEVAFAKEDAAPRGDDGREEDEGERRAREEEPTETSPAGRSAAESGPGEGRGPGREDAATVSRRLGPRRGSTRRRSGEEPPPLLEGQAVEPGGGDAASANGGEGGSRDGGGDEIDPAVLGLPTDREAAVRYLSNSYKGVGAKTAEALVDGFGEELFTVLQAEPQRVHDVVPAGRAEAVLDAWNEDFRRRRESLSRGSRPDSQGKGSGGGGRGPRRTRRGGRRS